MLLILFSGTAAPPVPTAIETAVITAPVVSYGYAIARPAFVFAERIR